MQANATTRKGRFRIVEFTNPSGAVAYRVTGWTIDGERIRQNFMTHAEAAARMRELEIQTANLEDTARPVVTRLTSEQAIVAERAFSELNGKSMIDAVRYYLANYREPVRVMSLANAVKEFIAGKERKNLRPATICNLRGRLDLFERFVGKKSVSEITERDCREFVHRPSTSPRTQVNVRLVLSNFLRWSVKHGYAATSPLATLEPARTERDEPAILTLPDIRKLLSTAAAFKGGKLVPYVVLGTFAAIRPAELARLTWDDIRLNGKATITITGKAAKLRARRVVDLSANAVEWLRPFALSKAPVVPTNFRNDWDRMRELAGLKEKWTEDVLRHTAVSMHLAKWQHEGRTALWAGNSPDVIQRHYRGLVTGSDATSFWRVAPDARMNKQKGQEAA